MAKAKTTSEFVTEARATHGLRYDYSRTKYTSGANKVTIVCPEHGPFDQIARSHLSGHGCVFCANSRPIDSLESFITKSRAIHGTTYDYSAVEYTGSRNKVVITCPQHGPFEQRVAHHLAGQGCLKCGLTGRDTWTCTGWTAIQAGRPALLYIVRMVGEQESFYKAGITLTSVGTRFASRKLPYTVETVAVFSSSDASIIYKAEKTLKRKFKVFSYLPNYLFGGHTECYTDYVPLIEFLASHSEISQLV